MNTITGRPKAMLSGVVALLCAVVCIEATAQDTLRITLQQAEKEFTSKNLLLLAEKYEIDAARAQVLQAGLINNPNLSVYGNIYNPRDRKFADIGNRSGAYVAELQQVIRLAGKRNKEVALAETSVRSAEARFYDLMRTLRFTLRSNFFEAYYIHSSITALNRQIEVLETLDKAYATLQQGAIVTVKDALRIRALLYSLKADRSSLQNKLNDVVSELKTLLRENHSFIIPVSEESAAGEVNPNLLNLQSLIDSAYLNRYDLRLTEAQIDYSKRNYALQKANAVPDLTVGVQFDKRGSYVDDATFLNLAIDLPFFKKNQGNIRSAGIAIRQSRLQHDQQRLVVENDVQRAFGKVLVTERLYASMDPEFFAQYEKLLQGINENFQRRNISLLEFTDFYESYSTNIQQLNQIKNDRIQALEDLQYSVGKALFAY